jgi:hypothetical protein
MRGSVLIFILLLTTSQAYAYSSNIVISGDKDSHAVLPGDLELAYCQPKIDENITKDDVYKKLRSLGHDISAVVRDKRFSLEHIKNIYTAILLMPEWLSVGSSFDSRSIKYQVDDSRNAVAWMKKSVLTINPLRWNKFVPDMRTSIIFHELSHLLGYKISNIDDSVTWQNIDGGWRSSSLRRDGSIYEGRPLSSTGLVSDYAMTNPAEDFAESISSYRIKPSVLKNLSPSRYEFIKDVIFLGNEFIDESHCNVKTNEAINFEEITSTFSLKLSQNKRHFDRAYKYAVRKRGQNPKRLELLFKMAAMRSVINSQGAGRNTSAEQFTLKNKLRIFLKNHKSIASLDQFQTSYSKSLLRKLINQR